ncbi:MAG: NAD(P)H-dependent oxidoreductase [Bacteriovorax sp.]|nr:NAD(P)H-dependent oxidoreductase [Bacteriovorax sp.]
MINEPKKILILNGSLGGASGNTSELIKVATEHLTKSSSQFEVIHLDKAHPDIASKLSWADGFIFTSGTYWDSWGSPLQKFLEETTQFEASDLFLFKPAAVMITMHSVGGKEVLSRLQGVLNTIGLLIPPMSGLVYALSTHLAMKSPDQSFNDDFWGLEDVEVVIHNLLTAIKKKHDFKAWPVDRKDPKRKWLEH